MGVTRIIVPAATDPPGALAVPATIATRFMSFGAWDEEPSQPRSAHPLPTINARRSSGKLGIGALSYGVREIQWNP
jgi:hypothetical protein